jgi:hypothetical protein
MKREQDLLLTSYYSTIPFWEINRGRLVDEDTERV